MVLQESDPPLWAKILVTILSITIFVYIPLMIGFYNNRKLHPIRGRMPLATMWLNIWMLLTAFWAAFIGNSISSFPCVIRNFIMAIFSFFWFSLYAYRLLRILFAYEITQNIMDLKNTTVTKKQDWKQNWYTRHRKFLRTKETYLIGLIFTIIYLILLFGITAINPKSYQDLKACEDLDEDYLLSRLTLFIFVLCSNFLAFCFIIFLAIKIYQKYKDALFLRTEVIWTTVIVCPCYMSWIVLRMLGNIYYIAFLVLGAFHVVFLTGTVWPFILAHKAKKLKEKQKSAIVVLELSDVLTTIEGFTAFLEYLQLEFSTENLLFWSEIAVLRKIEGENDVEKYLEAATEVYNKYLIPNAPFQVTIPSSLHQQIITRFSEVEYNLEYTQSLGSLLEQGQNEIYELLKNDSFLRFQQTEQYQKLKVRFTVTGGDNLDVSTPGLPLTVAERYANSTFDPFQEYKGKINNNSNSNSESNINSDTPTTVTSTPSVPECELSKI